MKVNVNDSFPEFSLKNQNGKEVNNLNFSGKWLIIYFYPKDDTKGCTIQGKTFTESKNEFDKENISIIGVSQDNVDSHKEFHDKFWFSIDLLSDEDCKLIKSIGIPQLEWENVKYWGRTTIIVDNNNIIRKIYEDVKPEEHYKIVLNDTIKLMSK